MLLADEFIERARTHARGKRCTIGALDFDVFVISEKILHEGNYGAPVMQAIVSACIPMQQIAPAADWRPPLLASTSQAGMFASRS